MAKKERYCMHVKANGSGCGSMVLLNRDYCYFHYRHYLREHHRILLKTNLEKRAEPAVEIPVLEDRASIQLAIMDVMRALIDQRISQKDASSLFYGLQLASSNLGDRELHKDSHMRLADVPLHPDDEDIYKELEEEKRERRRERAMARELAKNAATDKKPAASEPQLLLPVTASAG